MEGIEQATGTEETNGELDFDLTELENMAIEVPGTLGGDSLDEVPGTSCEELVLTETAKRKARGIVKWVERAFRFKFPGFEYSEEKYQQAEEELAPLLDKYDLAQNGAFKYSEEVEGAYFLGSMLFESVAAINAAKEDQPEQPEAQQQYGTIGGGNSGEQSKPFTTE